jgi:iron only hydrogenase large subunit-like protein
LVFEQRKNENFSDASVTLAEGREIKIAKVYGFKNIQNVVRQLKLNRCTYDFIEILACPSGCTNGGNPLFFWK